MELHIFGVDIGIFTVLSFIIAGIICGMAAGFFGIGGGTIIVPMMLLSNQPIHQAIGISIMQMIFSSIFGSIINYKKKLLNIKDGIYAGIGGFVGGSFSGAVVSNISSTLLMILFLAVTIYSFIKYAFDVKSSANSTPPVSNYFFQRLILVATGAVTGVFAISLGIGGGLLMVPILAYYLGYEPKKVVPLSLFFVIFSSFSGTISFLDTGILNHYVLVVGFLIGVSSMVGVFFGIKLIQKSSSIVHRRALLVIYTLSILITAYKTAKPYIGTWIG